MVQKRTVSRQLVGTGIRMHIMAILAVVLVLGLMMSGCVSSETDDEGFVQPEEEDDPPRGEGEQGALGLCGPTHAPAREVTSKKGTDEFWYQFHQFLGTGSTGGVYISWSLSFEGFDDLWALGVKVWDNQNEIYLRGHLEQQTQNCYYLGQIPYTFHYRVFAGGGIWEEESLCTVKTHWEDPEEEKLGYSITDPDNTTHGPYPWQGGYRCKEDDVRYSVVNPIDDQGQVDRI